MSVTARGITAGAAAIALGAFSLLATAQQNDDAAQERQRQLRERQQQQQQTERTGSADEVWGQVAELHRRIVQMEISQRQAAPGQRQGAAGQPGLREGAQNERGQAQRQAGQQDDDQPGRRTSPATAAGQSRSDALWNQLAQKHGQLVQMKLSGDQPQGAARTTPLQEATGQERQAQRNQPDQTASATEELEKEIGELYLQILEVDLAQARGSREVLRPDLNDQDPSQRPGQRTPRTPEQDPNN